MKAIVAVSILAGYLLSFPRIQAAAVRSRVLKCQKYQPGTHLWDYGPFGIGYGGDENSLLGFDYHHNVVVRSKATLAKNFTVMMEHCEALGPLNTTFPPPTNGYHYEGGYQGRLVVQPSNVVGPNTCLTVTNPQDAAANKPLFLKAQKCTSDIKPSAAQTFTRQYLVPEGLANILWVGDANTPCRKYGFAIQVKPDNYGFPVGSPSLGQAQLVCFGRKQTSTFASNVIVLGAPD